jgi:two-component system KDP operon response regulator KdpE
MTIRLKSEGYAVVSAQDAPTALMMARKHDPNLILLDISLPGGDGFQVAQCLRDQVLAKNVPIIFITASKKEGLREEAKRVGASAFLEKPFKAGQLLTAIEETLAMDAALTASVAWQNPRMA